MSFPGAMNKDLGCIEFLFIPYDEILISNYKYGLLFVHKSQTRRGGCWSALGRRPGFAGSRGSVTEYGAPNTWQLLQLEEMCGGMLKISPASALIKIFFFRRYQTSRPASVSPCSRVSS